MAQRAAEARRGNLSGGSDGGNPGPHLRDGGWGGVLNGSASAAVGIQPPGH